MNSTPEKPEPGAKGGTWYGIPIDANGVAQWVWPRKVRMHLSWHFDSWRVVPWICVTAYTRPLRIPRLSVIGLWLFARIELTIYRQ